MASSAPQPAAEFYEWALKRYQRRAAALTRMLVAITVLALLLAGIFMVQVRELETQNSRTSSEVDRLRAEFVEASSISERQHQRAVGYIRCLEWQTHRYETGMARLLRRNISLKAFVTNYNLEDCR